jgi:hypothetical protein
MPFLSVFLLLSNLFRFCDLLFFGLRRLGCMMVQIELLGNNRYGRINEAYIRTAIVVQFCELIIIEIVDRHFLETTTQPEVDPAWGVNIDAFELALFHSFN